jgi:hypothetical protein
MALRRVPLAASLAVTVALCIAGQAGASPTVGYGGLPRGDSVSATIARLAATEVGPASGVGVGADSLCWERDYTDDAGDASIDAIGYRLTYDCQRATWQLSVTLASALNPATFDSFGAEIDTDHNPNDGCGGFDVLVAGVFDKTGSSRGVVVATPSCDPNSWTPVATAEFSAAGTALSLSYSEHALGDAPQLVWNAGLVPKSQSAAVDDMPDHGVLVADGFLQEMRADDGYLLVDAAGGVHAYGNAVFAGDLSGAHVAQPVVGIARTGGGYWLLGRDGGVFSFGDAAFHGSTGAMHLNRPIVGMAPTPTGRGYWLVASDGGIFSFGDAAFHGSTGAMHLNRPIVAMAPTSTGRGYWLVASDGGIFSFGDAAFHGSTGAMHLSRPIVGMTASRGGLGYRFVAGDGGIFGFGDAGFFGGLGGGTPPDPIVGIG